MMANVFIFSIDDAAADVGVAMVEDHELENALPLIQEEILIEHFRRVFPDGKCYVWGVQERGDHFSTWDAMAENDLVLGYRNHSIVSAAHVLMKIKHPSLADRLWSKSGEGPFSLMCFTTEPYGGEVPIVPQMSIYLDRDCTGFTKLSPEKRDNIMRDYGSFETFVRLGLGYDFPFSFRHSE